MDADEGRGSFTDFGRRTLLFEQLDKFLPETHRPLSRRKVREVAGR
jgi:hypothetical protein